MYQCTNLNQTYTNYKFLKCEMCSAPILGHIEVKCRSLDGARYDREVVESLQNWMRRNKTFQQAVTERNKKNKNEEHEQMSETIKIMMESMENRTQTQMTQLLFGSMVTGYHCRPG